MAILLTGTTIGGHSAIHAGNLATHGIITTSNIGSYAITSIPTSFSSITVTSSFDTASNDVYASMRVIRNNSSTYQDGMYIGYGNSGSGPTRIFGGGYTSGELIKYATYTYEPGSFRAPIFYDSADTSYYLDPNSTSYLYHLVLSGNSYFRPNTWIQFDGNYGLYWPNNYALHLYPNNSGSYGALQINGTKGGWAGIHFDGSANTLMANSNESGFHRQGNGWQFRWTEGTMYVHRSTSGGGTAYTVLDTGNYNSFGIPTKQYIWSRGENLLTNGTALLGNNTNFSSFTFDGSQAYSSSGSFRYTGQYGAPNTDELMPVNAEKRYRLDFWAKTANGQGAYYAYLNFFDVDGNTIVAPYHMYYPNTLTTLAQTLNPGDTVAYLTSVANWENGGTAGVNTHLRSFIFWNYTNSFGYTYPPQTYSRNWYADAWNPGAINSGNNTITLRVPWSGPSIAAGTQVSNGSAGGTYKYIALGYTIVPTTWTNYVGIMDGIDYSGSNAGGKFPPGTAAAKLGFLTDYNGSGDTIYLANLFVGVDNDYPIYDRWTGNTRIEKSGAFYGTIFYDSNNGGYYLDPSSTSNLYRVDAAAQMRAPIFYDSQDTNYYLDPNSTSRLVTVNADTLRSYGNVYTDGNYGHGLVGLYSASRYQGVFAMGDAYKLSADGTSTGTLYGIAWTHTNVGGQSKSGLGHQALFMDNGNTQTAIGTGIWTNGLITTTSYGTSANWKSAYDWGNHASAGYLTSLPSHNHDDRYYTESEIDSQISNRLYQARVNGLNVDAFNATGLYRGSTSGWSNRPSIIHNGGALLTIDTHPGEYHSQFFFDTGGDRLYFRNANAGSWGSWLTMFHTGNYTSYVPTLTGSGASGTWNINVTGNAGSANTAGSSTNLYGSAGNIRSSAVGTSYSVNYQVRENDGGYGNTNIDYAPQLAFHWGNVVASSIMMEASGRMAIRNNPGTGYENFIAAVIYSSGYGDSTQWNTAYSWGNHASAGYLTSLPSHNHDDRYYTESESDSRYLSINGGTVTGWALFTASTQGTAIVRATQQDTSAGYYLFQGITGSSEVFRVERSGRLNSVEYIYSYGYRGNGNVGGTGTASWHPDGIYCGSTMWQYGTMYKNNTGIYGVSEIQLNAGLYLQTYNDRNLIVKGNSSSDAGIEGRNAAGNNVFQIYGSGSDYGFLNGTWAAWDIRKTKNGALYMNDTSGYYLYTNGTSNFYALNIQGSAVIHAGNIGSQSVSYASSAGSAGSVTGLTLTSSANGINPDSVTQNQIGYNTSVSLFGQTDGGLYSSAYSSAWIHQIYGDFRTGQIAIRGKNSGSWQAWRTVLDSSNYTSYAPSLTGSGASGTWSINVTGSAGSVAWTNVSSRPTALSQFSNDLGNYGGWITSSGSISGSAGSVPASGITGQAGMWTSSNRPGASKLYRNDSDDAYNVQTTWSADKAGHWSLRGYYSDSYHAPCYVASSGYADSAGSVAWGNVSSRPTNLSQFTNDLGNYGGFLTSITAHTHAISDISGLQTALDGKQAAGSYAASSHTHDDRYYTESESDTRFARKDTDSAISGNLVIGNGTYGNSTAYGNSGARLMFSGSDGDAQGNYYIGTNHNDYGGNYSKLELRWHTGIRMGAQPGYGGIRFYDTEDLGTVIFSVGTGDSHVRVANNLYVGGNLALHAGNYNSYSPTLTGGNASGTWGISVTGSAGSVAWTNVSSRPTALSQFSNDLGNYGGWLTTGGKAADSELIDGIDSSRIVYGNGARGKSVNMTGSSANTLDAANASGFYYGNAVTGMPDGNWWNWVSVTGNDWATSDGYGYQMAGSFWGDDFRLRRLTSGSWASWVSIIHSGNIGSQSVNYANSAGSASTAGTATSAIRLTRNGYITGEDWNGYYINNNLIGASVAAHSGPNRPLTSYNYGGMLSWFNSGEDCWQMYFPENSDGGSAAWKKLHYRTGWNGTWGPWRIVVDMVGNVSTIAGSNESGLEIHSNVGYNQDPLTYLLLRGQADNSWKSFKVRLTGDAGGQDIEFRRIAENGADARMFYVPRGANQVIFEYQFVQGSDSRLKDNIIPITNSLDKVKSLRGVEFDWNSGVNEGTHDVGLIAQDVEVVLPEAVTTQEDGYKNLAYTKVIPLLVEAMKEQQAMIDALKAEIELLKNK